MDYLGKSFARDGFWQGWIEKTHMMWVFSHGIGRIIRPSSFSRY